MAEKIYGKELERGEGVRIPIDENVKKYKVVRVRFDGNRTFDLFNPRIIPTKIFGKMLAGDMDDDHTRIRGMPVYGINWIKPLCIRFKYGDYVPCPEDDIWAIDESGMAKRM